MFIFHYNGSTHGPVSVEIFSDLKNYLYDKLGVISGSIFYQNHEILDQDDFYQLKQLYEISNVILPLVILPKNTEGGFFQSPVTCSARLNLSKWKIIRKVGQGAFGKVYLASYKNSYYAVKCSKTSKTDASKQLLNEVELLKRLSHLHVIQYFGYESDSYGNSYMAMEFSENGSIADILRKSGPLTVAKTRCFAKQILSALIYNWVDDVSQFFYSAAKEIINKFIFRSEGVGFSLKIHSRFKTIVSGSKMPFPVPRGLFRSKVAVSGLEFPFPV